MNITGAPMNIKVDQRLVDRAIAHANETERERRRRHSSFCRYRELVAGDPTSFALYKVCSKAKADDSDFCAEHARQETEQR